LINFTTMIRIGKLKEFLSTNTFTMAILQQTDSSMANNNRERDLVLAPNEYAYILDQTKGHIIAYVGPFKTSMANTDQPVYFNEEIKRFIVCNMEQSIKSFTTVPEGWYVMLKNPPQDGQQPVSGTSNSLTKLNIGRKVNIPGPAFFALWPGQMMRVIQGHRLHSNQYLIVRVYEEEEAKKNWNKAVIKPQKTITEDANLTEKDSKNVSVDAEMPDLSLGKMFIIKGLNVSFYIPPTGIEVARDKAGNYVREAVTLERLEYCILLDENGNKRYIKGPAVVFPEPTETFFEKKGLRKFKAIELSDTSGIYVKVIAIYTEAGKTFNVGDELFITGKDQMIYYPREEHALIRYGDHEIYNAVAIPTGEGRYYLNRLTGQISLKKGPCMFLPDPREFVIVQRVLTHKQAKFWYPGNSEVLEYNNKLQKVASKISQEEFLQGPLLFDKEKLKEVSMEIASDEFIRSQSYTSARTITLDTKYLGAVTICVWTGYAILVINKSGERKVIVGPQTYLLEYDEDLAVFELSTGTPKNDDNLIRTVYLRVFHNKVSDIVKVETKDLCPVDIKLSYRLNFEGEPDKWFNVENYVKFLTDHLRSVIRNAVQKVTIHEFYFNGIDILRDIILGIPDEAGKRNKGKFDENGMRIYDVEILNLSIRDQEIESMLFNAQHEEVRQKMVVATQKNTFQYTQETEDYLRKISKEKSDSVLQNINLQKLEAEQNALLSRSKIENDLKNQKIATEGEFERQKQLEQINKSKLAQEKATKDLQIEHSQKVLAQELQRLQAEVDAMVEKAEAVTPDLIAALQSFSDKALAEKMAESMAPMAILGGKSVAEILQNLLKGTVIENVLQKQLPVIKEKKKE